MTRARSCLISLSETPWYHLVNRCVRRPYLRGKDAINARCYEHHRGWIAQRMMQLSGVFAIDVASPNKASKQSEQTKDTHPVAPLRTVQGTI